MKRKVVALMLVGVMVSSAGYAGTTVYADTNSDQNKVNKTESVYVTAKANGSVKKIKVKETLKNPGGNADIEDYSKLSNIRNTDGEETYTEKGDGSLVWQNKGEDINYEGETSEKLQVSVKARYYLDGKEMKEKDIIERDYRDMHRETSPLKQADDAVLLDSSDLDIDGVVEEMKKIIKKAE